MQQRLENDVQIAATLIMPYDRSIAESLTVVNTLQLASWQIKMGDGGLGGGGLYFDFEYKNSSVM